MHSQTNNKIQFWEFYDITEKSVTTTNTLENFMLKLFVLNIFQAEGVDREQENLVASFISLVTLAP